MNALLDFLSTPMGKSALKAAGLVIGVMLCWAMGYKVIMILLLCIYLCVRFFVLFATFPGSGYISRKSFERSWEIGEAQQLHHFCQALLEIISCAQEKRSDREISFKLRKRLRWFDEVRLLCIHFQELKCATQLDSSVIKVREQIRTLWNTLENTPVVTVNEILPGGGFPKEFSTELKLIGLMEYYSKLPQDRPIPSKKYSFKNFRDYDEVAQQASLLIKEVDELMNTNNGMIASQKRKFLKPRVMGSLEELRLQQANRRPLVRLEVPISYFCKLDSALILPKITEETEIRQMERIKSVEQYIYDTKILSSNLNSQSEQSLTHAATQKSCITHNKLVIVYCNPNAGLYEIADLGESSLIDSITSENQGFVYLWNYRGYGASSSSPSMRDLADDGKQILKFLRCGLRFSKVIFWGRSIGGHACKEVSGHADGIIIDRSFSIISSVPRNMFKKAWVQQAYELILGSHNAGIEELCRSTAPKILLSSLDSDEVIPTFGSVHTAVTAELTDAAFGSKSHSVKYYNQLKSMPRWLAATPLWKRYLNSAMHTSYSDWIESHISKMSGMIMPKERTSEIHSILSSFIIQAWNTIAEKQKQQQQPTSRPSSSPFDNMPHPSAPTDKQETSEDEDAPTNDHSSVELTNTRDQSLMHEDNQTTAEANKPVVCSRRDYTKALTHLAGSQQILDRFVQVFVCLEQTACTSSSLVRIYGAAVRDEEDEDSGFLTCNALNLWIVDAIVWGFSTNHREYLTPEPNMNCKYQTRLQVLASTLKQGSELIKDAFPLLNSCFESGCDPLTAEIGGNLIADLGKLCDFFVAISWRVNMAYEIFSGKTVTEIPDTLGSDNTSGFKHFLSKLSESNFLELRSTFVELDLASSHNQEIPVQAVKKVVKHMLEAVKYNPWQLRPSPEQTSILDTSSL